MQRVTQITESQESRAIPSGKAGTSKNDGVYPIIHSFFLRETWWLLLESGIRRDAKQQTGRASQESVLLPPTY